MLGFDMLQLLFAASPDRSEHDLTISRMETATRESVNMGMVMAGTCQF